MNDSAGAGGVKCAGGGLITEVGHISYVGDVHHDAGRPLDDTVRQEMEAAFGVEFASVCIHTSERADHLCALLDADACTRGAHVYFRTGRYAPYSVAGRRLLAHELAHVVQQRSAPPQPAGASPDDPADSPTDSPTDGPTATPWTPAADPMLEFRADCAAAAVASRMPIAPEWLTVHASGAWPWLGRPVAQAQASTERHLLGDDLIGYPGLKRSAGYEADGPPMDAGLTAR